MARGRHLGGTGTARGRLYQGTWASRARHLGGTLKALGRHWDGTGASLRGHIVLLTHFRGPSLNFMPYQFFWKLESNVNTHEYMIWKAQLLLLDLFLFI